MALDLIEYLLIAGQRYRVLHDRFTRYSLPVEPSQLTSKRVQPPFVDAVLAGFRGGIDGANLNDSATHYRDALGLEPVGADIDFGDQITLRTGLRLTEVHSAVGSGVIRPLLGFRGRLYAGELGAAVVLDWDGATWTATATGIGGVGGIRALANYNRKLYASNGASGVVASNVGGGAAWVSPAFTATGSTGIHAMASLLVSGVLRLYVVADEVLSGTTAARVYYWNDTALSAEQFAFEERWARSACVHGGAAYFGGAETGDPISGAIYKFDGSSWTRPAAWEDNYPTVCLGYAGKTWWGMAENGQLYSFDGSTLVLEREFPTTLALRGLFVSGGVLWVSVYDDTNDRILFYRYDGTSWSQPNYIGATNDEAAGIGIYDGVLYVGSGSGTTRRIYRLTTATYVQAAELEGPNVIFGAPEVQKRWLSARLQHSALVGNQTIELRYKLDDGAEVAVGLNHDLGSQETVFELPTTVVGRRFRPKWYLVNGSTQTITLYAASVRALPTPESREVWEATLSLHPRTTWPSDATADTDDALVKLERLRALQLTGQVFQAADIFRDGTEIKRAMRAAFDPQVPLQWQLFEGPSAIELQVPIRLVEAAGPLNLVVNSSFRQPGVNQPPDNWTATSTGTSSNVSTAVTAQDGSEVLAVIFDGASASYGRTQSISGLTPGRYYTLSGYIRRATSAGTTRLDVQDDLSNTSTAAALASATDTAFTRYSVTFLLPTTASGTVTVRCWADGTPAGTAYFDAIMLEEGAPASTFRERGSVV